ncbi:MAG: Ppx/GppA family phosphatase [Alphaproteobacteria bacterium]|nr:Ppx/GppA family phosphatase [Alphaproteobacteria bacterium]
MSLTTAEITRPTPRQPAGTGDRRLAVVDVGSNSVRLVVYEGLVRAPLSIFNEKVLAQMGRGLRESGRLNPEGRKRALAAIDRFVALSGALGAGLPEIVATAAVRDAEDGAEFVDLIEKRTGHAVRVLNGREEARLSALGVAAAVPDADGIMGDLGGGSLELVRIDNSKPSDGVTLPLGTLMLSGVARSRANEVVTSALGQLEWLWKEAAGRTFYAVGGAWRSFARLDMARKNYPLHIVHHYRMGAAEAMKLAEAIAGLSEKSVQGLQGIDKGRADTMPHAALVLGRVLTMSNAKEVVFSANGVREGVVHDRLPPRARNSDPLLEAVTRMVNRSGRGAIVGEELRRWSDPLFADESLADGRLRSAACHLSDIAWSVHPDYRTAEAVSSILHAPFVGIDHPGRAFVAVAVGVRYGDEEALERIEQARALLDEATADRAARLGRAMRLGHTFCGAAAGVLPATRLTLGTDTLKLTVPSRWSALLGEKIEKRLESLAKAFTRKPELSVEV